MEGGVGVSRGCSSRGTCLSLGREEQKAQESVMWPTTYFGGASKPSHRGAAHTSDGSSIPKIVVHIWSGEQLSSWDRCRCSEDRGLGSLQAPPQLSLNCGLHSLTGPLLALCLCLYSMLGQ